LRRAAASASFFALVSSGVAGVFVASLQPLARASNPAKLRQNARRPDLGNCTTSIDRSFGFQASKIIVDEAVDDRIAFCLAGTGSKSRNRRNYSSMQQIGTG
jgi:hypothetical protein